MKKTGKTGKTGIKTTKKLDVKVKKVRLLNATDLDDTAGGAFGSPPTSPGCSLQTLSR